MISPLRQTSTHGCRIGGTGSLTGGMIYVCSPAGDWQVLSEITTPAHVCPPGSFRAIKHLSIRPSIRLCATMRATSESEAKIDVATHHAARTGLACPPCPCLERNYIGGDERTGWSTPINIELAPASATLAARLGRADIYSETATTSNWRGSLSTKSSTAEGGKAG